MPRRFFRKFALKRHQIGDQWFLAPFQHLLHDRQLWGIRRRNVVPAVALGLFIAFQPFPGHTVAAILLALLLRINIPIAALTTWVSNPATVVPMYYISYQLGTRILGLPEKPFAFEFSIEWLTQTFTTMWQPLLLGCTLLGLAAALFGYVMLDAFWRFSLADYKSQKKKRRGMPKD